MTIQREEDPLAMFSDAMADAVDKAGAATLLVEARLRHPATGISYAPDLVLTASHAVEREEDIRVGLMDGTVLSAALAGRDPGTDLALLRLESSILTVAEAETNPARIGELVLALGRPTLEGIQASLGIVSSIGGPVRSGRGSLLEHYIRTDAIPYPGFSGGPLINAAGRVLGMNTSGLANGVLIAIPTSLAWQTANALASHGYVRRGYLGIRNQPVSLAPAQRQAMGRDQESGLLIVGLEENGPAVQGGLLVGDILVGLAGQPVSGPDDLLARLTGSMVNQTIPIEVVRGSHLATIPVTIGERK